LSASTVLINAAELERSPDLDAIEARFFSSIRMPNGTFKSTNAHRLDDLNVQTLAALARDQATLNDILDVAASSGVSSVEWADALAAAGFKPRASLSDLSITAYLITYSPSFRVLVDRRGSPLQFEILGIPVAARPTKFDVATGRAILTVLSQILHRTRSRGLDLAKLDKGVPADADVQVQRVTMLSRRALARADIQYFDDDICAPNAPGLKGRFDAIRAANILQYGYFDEDTLRMTVTNLKERLRGPGSWLIICRTHPDGTNNGTVFRLEQDGRFAVKARVGTGSEIEQIVTALGD
jgi:hypothetical protein